MTNYSFQVTEAVRAQYRDEGFFITPVLFEDSTLAKVRDAMNAIWEEDIQANDDDAGRLRLVRERPFIADMHARSTRCTNFLKHTALLDLARQMIGSEVDVAYNQAVIKPPTGDIPNSFAWHQDSFYACRRADDDLYRSPEWDESVMTGAAETFQGWVALTRTTADNGTLEVLPGRHKEGFLKHDILPETRELAAEPDTTNQITVELEAGQMLVFSGMLPHRSGPNVTEGTRMVYQFCYGVPGTRHSDSVYPVLRNDEVV